MVVLEANGMLSTAGNQYLQPDYLSPLPTTLDAKKSPLALLAQTCSQIGADSPSTKPLISQLDKSSKKPANQESVSRTSPKSDKPVSRCSPTDSSKLAFKPYETNVSTVGKKTQDVDSCNSRPSSKTSLPSSDTDIEKKDRRTVSPLTKTPVPTDSDKASPGFERKTPSARGASPIIRSGLEILQGKDSPLGAYKPSAIPGLPGLNPLCCPPGLEQHGNPAFRPPFPGVGTYPMLPLTAGPYLSYARVKTPSGGEALVPVCKDPYCTGCQFSLQNQHLLMNNGTCPSGCTQCDHQKYNLAMAMSLVPPPGSLAGYASLGRPYICNWIAGESYCGKRFVTSEELLQHLRSHTATGSVTDPVTSAANSLLNQHSLFTTAASLHRGYPTNPPLSPLSAARYHPYATKPAGLPGSLAGSPYSAFNPTALGAYYSPYSLYGQRIGAAAVHQ